MYKKNKTIGIEATKKCEKIKQYVIQGAESKHKINQITKFIVYVDIMILIYWENQKMASKTENKCHTWHWFLHSELAIRISY